MFPLGPLVNSFAVLIAGFLGGLVGSRLKERVATALSVLMGFVALAIGIILTIQVQTLPAVVLSLVLGTLIGSLLKLDDRVSSLFAKINKKFFKQDQDEEKSSMFNTVLVLCCVSGTGIFGAINEGLGNGATMLICKAIMDFVTVFIFASYIGKSCALISIPQVVILLLLFFLATFVKPVVDNPILKGDFSAVGGIIELIIGFRILKLTKMKVIDTLPSIILIFLVTWIWNLALPGHVNLFA